MTTTRNSSENQNKQESVESRMNRRLADYTMVADLIAELSNVDTEKDAVQNIFDLFTMLCAPEILGYLPLVNEAPGMTVWRPESCGDMGAMKEKASDLKDACIRTESGKGFFLLLSHREDVVGILKVDGIAFPQYITHYLNLALTISKVCGLAIANARKYQKIKDSEKQIERYARDLEQANEDVKRFAYIISHDLKAPLVNIKGFSFELRYAAEQITSVISSIMLHLDPTQRERLDAALGKDIPEALEFIESSAGVMDKLISSILKLSRLGHHELKPEALDMKSIVLSILEEMAYQVEERNAGITIGSLPTLVADRSSMEHILGNLLNNALKYFQPGRRLEIGIDAEKAENETIIHVRDNGRGIAENDMDKVFAPFRRAGEQNVPGDGMGLSYVQALVRRNGGRIWCESNPGAGTVFSFTITEKNRRFEHGNP